MLRHSVSLLYFQIVKKLRVEWWKLTTRRPLSCYQREEKNTDGWKILNIFIDIIMGREEREGWDRLV